MGFKVLYKYSDGTEEYEDETYDTWDEADEAGQYGCSCYSGGNEILNMSNPGDYPLDEDGCDYEVIED